MSTVSRSRTLRERIALIAAFLLLGTGAPPAAPANQDDPRLADLFRELHGAANPLDAQLFEDAIWRVWLQTGEPELDELMQRGIAAMGSGQPEEAMRHYDEVIRRAPTYAEGWNKRATLHFLLRNYDASIADIDKTLALEPRHFGALAGLGQIRDALEQPDEALEAYERALLIHPHLISVKLRIEQLREDFKRQQI